WPVPSQMPVINTIHYVMPLQYPVLYPSLDVWTFRAAARDAAKRAVRIIAVSQTVAEAAVTYAGIESERIRVVHEGVDERFRTPPSEDAVRAVCARFGLEPKGYFIYVGRI